MQNKIILSITFILHRTQLPFPLHPTPISISIQIKFILCIIYMICSMMYSMMSHISSVVLTLITLSYTPKGKIITSIFFHKNFINYFLTLTLLTHFIYAIVTSDRSSHVFRVLQQILTMIKILLSTGHSLQQIT